MSTHTIWWEGMVVILVALLGGVLPDQQEEAPSREAQVDARCKETLDAVAQAVTMSWTKQYCEQFDEKLAKEIRPKISAILDSPKCHNLNQRYKVLGKEVQSHVAVYRVAFLTISICPTGYKDNIEYAKVTLVPVAESGEGKFFTEPSNDPAEMRWQITKWETQKVVPYDRSRD